MSVADTFTAVKAEEEYVDFVDRDAEQVVIELDKDAAPPENTANPPAKVDDSKDRRRDAPLLREGSDDEEVHTETEDEDARAKKRRQSVECRARGKASVMSVDTCTGSVAKDMLLLGVPAVVRVPEPCAGARPSGVLEPGLLWPGVQPAATTTAELIKRLREEEARLPENERSWVSRDHKARALPRLSDVKPYAPSVALAVLLRGPLLRTPAKLNFLGTEDTAHAPFGRGAREAATRKRLHAGDAKATDEVEKDDGERPRRRVRLGLLLPGLVEPNPDLFLQPRRLALWVVPDAQEDDLKSIDKRRRRLLGSADDNAYPLAFVATVRAWAAVFHALVNVEQSADGPRWADRAFHLFLTNRNWLEHLAAEKRAMAADAAAGGDATPSATLLARTLGPSVPLAAFQDLQSALRMTFSQQYLVKLDPRELRAVEDRVYASDVMAHIGGGRPGALYALGDCGCYELARQLLWWWSGASLIRVLRVDEKQRPQEHINVVHDWSSSHLWNAIRVA